MHWDYGYMEEGELGKPYNLRLLKRLAGYAAPYRRAIAGALLLTLLLTVIDLALPYLSKVAIDRFILSSWTAVKTANGKAASRKLIDRYTHILEETRNPDVSVISNLRLKKMDPADRQTLRSLNVLGSQKYYRIRAPSGMSLIEGASTTAIEMRDGSVLISHEFLDTLPRADILKIRAGDVAGVRWVALVLLALLLCSFLLNYAQYFLLEFTGQHVMQDIRLNLYLRVQKQSLRFFDRHPVGRLVTRVTNDVENLNEMFKSVIITIFKDLFLLAGILVVLLYLNWRMALISFALLPLIFAVTYFFSTMAREVFRELRATVAKINGFLQERLSGMHIIQLFAQEDSQLAIFDRINHENFRAGLKQIRVFAFFMPAMELLSSVGVAFIIWYGGGKVVQDQLTLGSLVAFVGYIQMFFKPIRDISEKYNIMQLAMASTERIFEFMDLREEIPDHSDGISARTGRSHLQFNRVSFSYDAGKTVLDRISFEVAPGETVAIVGPTGSGKTTIVNLAERFYDPDQGEILLNGVDLRKWPKEKLRGLMGLCLQDVFLFAGSIGENITLGREEVTPSRLKEAAGKANAWNLIQRLPRGAEQKIGEAGRNLSAGERQLLSFARALAADPPLLILDEATSSVDPETEQLIQDAIGRMSARRTTLVIAHRLSTIRGADRILVLHRGRLVEQGTHHELMARKGIYYKLTRLRTP